MRTAMTLLLLGCCLMSLSGCNAEQIALLRQGLVEARDVLETAKTEAVEIEADILVWDELIADLPEGDSKERAIRTRQRLVGGLGKAEGIIDKAAEKADEVLLRLQDAENAWDVADAGVKTAAPLLPEGPRTWLLLGWAIIASIRARLNRVAGRQISTSLQSVVSGGDFNAAEVRAIQGKTAGKIVDEAQGKAYRRLL